MIDFGELVVGPLIDQVFGQPVTYTPTIGSPFPINGVFDNAYKHIKASEFAPEIISLFPALGVVASDFPSPPVQGDELTIISTGKTYTVREPLPDSQGGTWLLLNYVSG